MGAFACCWTKWHPAATALGGTASIRPTRTSQRLIVVPTRRPHRITRGDLAQGLERTLASEPLFAPYVVPLIAEKLSSSIRRALHGMVAGV